MKTQMFVVLVFCSLGRGEETNTETQTGPAAEAKILAAKIEAAYKGIKYLEMEVDLIRGWDTPEGKGSRNYRAVVTTRADWDHSLTVLEGTTLVAAITQREEAWLAANSKTVPAEVIAKGTAAPTETDEAGHVKYTLTTTEGQTQREDIWFTTIPEVEQETGPSVPNNPLRWITDERNREVKNYQRVGCAFGNLQYPWIGTAQEPGYRALSREGRYKGREVVNEKLCDVVAWDRSLIDGSGGGFRRVDTLYTDAETHLFVRVVTEQYDLPSNRMDVWMVSTYTILNHEEKGSLARGQ